MPRPEGKPFAIPKLMVWEAWRQVMANKGAPGVDGQDLDAFEADLEDNLYKIWNRMSSGTWFPPPVRAVEIPKPHGGGVRMLGVPTTDIDNDFALGSANATSAATAQAARLAALAQATYPDYWPETIRRADQAQQPRWASLKSPPPLARTLPPSMQTSGLIGHFRAPKNSDVRLWGEISPAALRAFQPAKLGSLGVSVRLCVGADSECVPCLCGVLDGGVVARCAVVGLEIGGIDVARRDHEQSRRRGSRRTEQRDPVWRATHIYPGCQRVHGRRPQCWFAREVGLGRDRHTKRAGAPGCGDLWQRSGFGGRQSVGLWVMAEAPIGQELHRLEPVLKGDSGRAEQEVIDGPIESEPGHQGAVIMDWGPAVADDAVHVRWR